MGWDLILQFLILTAVVSGVIIFVLYRVFISSVDGAKQRLESETDTARRKQSELNQKIKEADKELENRRAELREIEQKLRGEVEEEANQEKEKILNTARQEAEEVIVKAQGQCEKLKKEAEGEIELRVLDVASAVIEKTLPEKDLVIFDQAMAGDFIQELADVDMSRINDTVKEAEVITARGLDDKNKTALEKTIKDKLGRAVTLNLKKDKAIISGVVLKFGSMMLDGSLRNSFKQEANALKVEVEKQLAG